VTGFHTIADTSPGFPFLLLYYCEDPNCDIPPTVVLQAGDTLCDQWPNCPELDTGQTTSP